MRQTTYSNNTLFVLQALVEVCPIFRVLFESLSIGIKKLKTLRNIFSYTGQKTTAVVS